METTLTTQNINIAAINVAPLLEERQVDAKVRNNILTVSTCLFEISGNAVEIFEEGDKIVFPYTLGEKAIASMISAVLKKNNKKKISDDIIDTVLTMGITTSMRGYRYIIEAIEICVQDFDKVYALSKEVYPHIAKQHSVEAGSVERNMRSAIEKAFSECPELITGIFKRPISKPCCSDIIAEVSDTLRRRYYC